MKFKTIANRIFALVVPTVIITTVSFALFSYFLSNSRINRTIDEKMQESLHAADLEIQLELYKNASVAIDLSLMGRTITSEAFSLENHKQRLADAIGTNMNTFGGGIWFEPYTFDEDSYYFGSYMYIDESGEIFFTHEYEMYADYFNEDWYIKGKASDGEIVWSKVYYDPFSRRTMVTASKAFFDDGGKLTGMGTADMNLENIRSIVNKISVGSTGKAFIIGANGEYISFFEGNKNAADTMLFDPDEALAHLGAELVGNETGTTTLLRNGIKQRVYYTTMDSVGWTLGIVFDESEIRSSTISSAMSMLSIPFFGLMFVIIGILAISEYLRTIINKVNNIADLAASGDFSQRIEVSEIDEFGFMERRLNKMISNMSDMRSRSDELLNITENSKRLLHAVNNAASVMLASDEENFESSLREGMELMARCMDVDRIYIWRNDNKQGVLRYVMEFEWLNADCMETGNNSEPRFDRIPEWEEKFLIGESINGPMAGLLPDAHKSMESYVGKSALVVPVFMHEYFWGVVSFEDFRNDRVFVEDEVNILFSASLMMINAMLRNETAATVREADERAKIMLDATPLCCSLMDKDANIIDCNQEVSKLYGIENKQIYLDNFSDFSPERQPDGQLSMEKASKMTNAAFKTGRSVFEWMHRKLDGTPIPCEVTLVRVRRGNEDILAGYTRDLREYTEMMRQRDHKDELLHVVNNSASVLLQSGTDEFEINLWQCMGMMAKHVDVDRVYIWKNHKKDGDLRCTQLYEWSEGAEPQQGRDITIDISYSESVPGWEETLSGGRCINGIVRLMNAETQEQLSPQGILSILVVPVFLRDIFWGFVGFDDCHKERLFSEDEEAILRSGSLLIANALLRNEMTLDIEAAVEQAQAASRAKSNFLSNMSHEIRTPINAITGMTQIGKAAPDVERKDYALGKIENASYHLLGVINDILDMSKIEADRFELSEVEYSFERMLQKVVGVISFRLDEKKQHFTVFLDKDIPGFLMGDDQRLAQVITNLLSNAVKFTPEEGTIRLAAHLMSEEDDLCVILIEVSDDGIGIDPARIEQIFKPFIQAENDTSRQYGGSGLGLSISKHIVELMGGDLWVESELGKGSNFKFTIRAKRGKKESRGNERSAIARKDIAILVVDDDPEVREYFAGIAERLGIMCDSAPGGLAALEMIDKKDIYNMYFVDWRMPGMNGIELAREIKDRHKGEAIVIMISVVEWSEIEHEARLAGVDRFLSKPLFPSSIADLVNEYLGEQSILEDMNMSEESVSFGGRRILLAEDVEINQEIVQALLEPTEIEIDCAANGVEALKMFEASPDSYDLIFMDVQMPEMDGLEATRRIRSLSFDKAEEIPIIAMTANVFKEDIDKCIESGMNDHIGKPIDYEEMIDKLKYYLPS